MTAQARDDHMSDGTSKVFENLGVKPELPDSSWSDFEVTAHYDAVCDLVEVRRALGILTSPGETRELRAINQVSKHVKSNIISGDDLDAAVAVVRAVCDYQVYYSLNPIQPGTDRAKKKTVLNRRWFLIDIDTIRPDKDVSATDDEKSAAGLVAIAVLEHLMNLGWPAPVFIDSGNGWHLLYQVNLPNSDLSQQIIKSCLYELANKFDNVHALIDRSTHDAPRIAKLPGTWARKGPDSLERPHRLCKLISGDSRPDITSVEKLQALANSTPAPTSTNGSHVNDSWPVVGGGLAGYVRAAIERESFKVAIATHGTRNGILNAAAFSLGTLSGWPEMNEREARSTLGCVGERSGLTSQECLQTIESGWLAGSQKPRARPAEPHVNGKVSAIASGNFIIWATSVKPVTVEWLDPGRIPVGKMTTFAGQTGLGKTFTICDLAARVTSGNEIPFSGGVCYKRGKVLIISAEDDADDTIVPRFMQLGGDLSRLALLSPECEERFALSSLELLNGCLNDMGPDVRMVAIDPPTSYLGKVDDHRNAELRGLLSPLKRWARQNKIALVFVTHVNKPGVNKVEALARVMGSVAWVAAVRSAHMFCPDPSNPSRNLYLPLKVNNAKKPKGLAYEIRSTSGDMATLTWLEQVDTTADDAMNQVMPRKSAGQSAVEWLIGKFREKTEWRSEDLREMAKNESVSFYAVFKSPEVNALPIDKKQRVDGNGERFWIWRARTGWPPKQTESAESAESDVGSPF